MTDVLEKIKITTGIDYNGSLSNGNRVLSHYQYTNLILIMNELISNSVKHSGCNTISFEVKASDKELRIAYSDNGKGLEPEQLFPRAGNKPVFEGNKERGIGLQNMEERTTLLNGSFHQNNNYPNGYSIVISIPLL